MVADVHLAHGEDEGGCPGVNPLLVVTGGCRSEGNSRVATRDKDLALAEFVGEPGPKV